MITIELHAPALIITLTFFTLIGFVVTFDYLFTKFVDPVFSHYVEMPLLRRLAKKQAEALERSASEGESE